MSQAKVAKKLFVSDATYSRKENGLARFERNEALRVAKILNLNEDIVLRYWTADRLYELMRYDKDVVYDALKIVETNFENYGTCVELPKINNSYSTKEERRLRRNKK